MRMLGNKTIERLAVGTLFIAGSYGVGKSTLCHALSKALGVPAYSAGDLISGVNGELYGANKAVRDKYANQDILAAEVNKRLAKDPTILLAGHFCIFDKLNRVEVLPFGVFEKISLAKILLLEADPLDIITNLHNRDGRDYTEEQIGQLLEGERRAAEEVAKHCGCVLVSHLMRFDGSDSETCRKLMVSAL